ncbi:hypothetical protein [Caldithrix abyssi]
MWSLKKIIIIILIAVLLMSCASVMMKVGKLAQSALTIKTANVADATSVVRIIHSNRPYHLTKTEKDYLASMGKEAKDFNGAVTLMLFKGIKFIDFDGQVLCNGKAMTYYGSGTYGLVTPVQTGKTFKFELKGNGQPPVTFTQRGAVNPVKLLEPQPGGEIDLAKGFKVKWTGSGNKKQAVKISLIVNQLGFENVLPLGYFPDIGQAVITKQRLAELNVSMQKIKTPDNYLYLERVSDKVNYVLNGDGIVTSVNADVIPVKLVGKAAKAKRPVLEGFTIEDNGVTVTVNEAASITNLKAGNAPILKLIKNMALTSFVMKGKTGGIEVKTKTIKGPDVKIKKTIVRTWGFDFKRDFLINVTNTMADQFMALMQKNLGLAEVPTEKVLSTSGYQWLNKVDQESDLNAFYVTARNTTSFDGFRQLKVKIGGLNSWYYAISQEADCDMFVELYLDFIRQKPEAGKANVLDFDIKATLATKIYPYGAARMYNLPLMEASWKSETWETGEKIKEREFLMAVRYQDFLSSLDKALTLFKQKVDDLPL